MNRALYLLPISRRSPAVVHGLNQAANPGLGSRIVQLLTQQLEGEIVYERLDPGLRVRLRAQPQ